MSKYYYLVTGLPELTLDDAKLAYSVANFRTEFYPFIAASDKKLIDLFYLQYDNANVLKLLNDKDAPIDSYGLYSADELRESISALKKGDCLSGDSIPSYLSDFISEYFNDPGVESYILEGKLATLYYSYAMKCKNRFISSWFNFNLTANNILVALTARKYKISDVASLIVGNTPICQALRESNARDFGISSEVDYWEQIIKIAEMEDLVERERKIDQLRWDWLEEQNFFNYFTIECLFVFLLKLGMIERWISLDKEKGNQMFRNIISTLKDEVQIPVEFR